MKKEILIIVNPCAGKGKINKYIPDICDNLEKQGYELEVVYTSEENNGEKIIENYIRYIDTVVVCGGDGTVNEVVNGIIKCNKKINLTFIPFGTTNDFAKTVKIPRRKIKLSKKLSKYEKKSIDIGSFNSKYFYYVAAFGMFTNISYETKQKDKNKLGRLAYFKEGLKSYKGVKKLKTYEATIVTDDEIIKDKFVYGSISNSISIGGFKWFKRNDFKINDGLFEIILIKKPKNFRGMLKILISILRKKYDQKNIFYIKSKHLKIDFEKPVEWTLDGEYGGKHKEILVENNKNKIGILVPKKRRKV
mgnify:CR=1 FL=1